MEKQTTAHLNPADLSQQFNVADKTGRKLFEYNCRQITRQYRVRWEQRRRLRDIFWRYAEAAAIDEEVALLA